MKRTFLLFGLCLVTLFCLSCKQVETDDTNSANVVTPSNNVSTSRVLIKTTSNYSTYEFINNEGVIYKSGNVYENETITINHFVNGTYNLRTLPYATASIKYLTITISKDCTIILGSGSSSNPITVQ